MATLIVIVGFCGSGKSHLLRVLQSAFPTLVTLNEGFCPDGAPPDWFSAETVAKRDAILAVLRTGGYGATIDMTCCTQAGRVRLQHYVDRQARGTKILWVFYENDRATADYNCLNQGDPVERPDPEGNVAQNARVESSYSIPPDAVVLKIHRVGGRG